MRVSPAYIGKLVKEYDPLLDVEWDEREHVWYLTCEGVRLFSLDHEDGTPIRNLDGHGTELLAIIRRCDQRNRAGAVRRRLRGARADHAYRARRERAGLLEECAGEAKSVVKYMKHGPTPMIGGPAGR